MKKTLATICVLITMIMVTSCRTEDKNVEINSSKNSNDSNQTSDDYDPFAPKENDDISGVAASFDFGVNWKGEELVLDYKPTIEYEFFLNNSADKKCGFALLMFVNGIRQPYQFDGSDEDILHHYDVNSKEKKTATIRFSPVTGKKCDTLSVYIVTMFEPTFSPVSTTPEYGHNFRISQMSPVTIDITDSTGNSDISICTDYIRTEISSEMRSEYNQIDVDGNISGNSLENSQLLFGVIKNGAYISPSERITASIETLTDASLFTKNDFIDLWVSGGGEECKYRVSMYVNHKLVEGAFDGYDYLDVAPSKDVICSKKIELSTLNVQLDEYNHIYFMAVPIEQNTDGARGVDKSQNVTFVN